MGKEEEIFDRLDDPIRSDVRYHIAQAHFTEGLSESIKGGNIEERVIHFEVALHLGLPVEDEIAYRALLAGGYFEMEKSEEAVNQAEIALSLDSERGFQFFSDEVNRGIFFSELDAAYCLEARSLRERHGIDSAISYLKGKLALVNPIPGTHMPLIHLELGNLYAETGQKDLAISSFRDVIKCKDIISPGFFEIYFNELELEAFEMAQHNLEVLTGGAKERKCFIATAVYQSPYAPEVLMLKKFRDEFLLPNDLGRLFVSLYCRASPALVSVIANNRLLQRLTKLFILEPILRIIRGCGTDFLLGL